MPSRNLRLCIFSSPSQHRDARADASARRAKRLFLLSTVQFSPTCGIRHSARSSIAIRRLFATVLHGAYWGGFGFAGFRSIRNPDIVRASEFKHPVQADGGDGDLCGRSLVSTRSKYVTNYAFVRPSMATKAEPCNNVTTDRSLGQKL